MRWKREWQVLVAAGAGLLVHEWLQRMREDNLRGQVVLITGGSKGLGLILARLFAAEGCKLVICSRTAADLERARRDLEGRGADVLAMECDVSQVQQVDGLIRAATDRFGRIDVLVNNAAIIQVGPVQNMSGRDFEETMNTVFWGTVYPSLAVLPQMLARQQGRIVNITSLGGKIPVPHLLPYTSAKFAATGFSEGLRAEMARYNIRVTTIAPGLLRTGAYLNAEFKGQLDKEFNWFATGENLPGFSMDAERAGRQIVTATKRGESERVLSLPAWLAVKFHGVFPGTFADIYGWVNRFNAQPVVGGARGMKGRDLEPRIRTPFLRRLLRWQRPASERYHQPVPEGTETEIPDPLVDRQASPHMSAPLHKEREHV